MWCIKVDKNRYVIPDRGCSLGYRLVFYAEWPFESRAEAVVFARRYLDDTLLAQFLESPEG